MQEGYVEASRVTGLADRRMIVRYILPNIAAALTSATTLPGATTHQTTAATPATVS